jgi:hypothetical protein
MRTPIKSEGDAFRLVCSTAGLCGLSIALGTVTRPGLGAIGLGLGLLAALAWEFLTVDGERRRPLREAAAAPHAVPSDGSWRILVVANESLGGDAMRDRIMAPDGTQPELVVVAPVLPSRVHYVATDIDREMGDARKRLEDSLAWASAQGVRAWGVIGNTNPLTAIEDELRRYGADEVIVATHTRDRANWMERRIVRRVREELDLPVTQIEIDIDGGRTAVRMLPQPQAA